MKMYWNLKRGFFTIFISSAIFPPFLVHWMYCCKPLCSTCIPLSTIQHLLTSVDRLCTSPWDQSFSRAIQALRFTVSSVNLKVPISWLVSYRLFMCSFLCRCTDYWELFCISAGRPVMQHKRTHCSLHVKTLLASQSMPALVSESQLD